MPGINDDPRQVEELVELLGEAGAQSIGGVGLHLRGELKEIWFDWLRQYRPDLVARYEELYRGGAYLPPDEARRLSGMARGGSTSRRFTAEVRTEHEAAATASPAQAAQPRLF